MFKQLSDFLHVKFFFSFKYEVNTKTISTILRLNSIYALDFIFHDEIDEKALLWSLENSRLKELTIMFEKQCNLDKILSSIKKQKKIVKLSIAGNSEKLILKSASKNENITDLSLKTKSEKVQMILDLFPKVSKFCWDDSYARSKYNLSVVEYILSIPEITKVTLPCFRVEYNRTDSDFQKLFEKNDTLTELYLPNSDLYPTCVCEIMRDNASIKKITCSPMHDEGGILDKEHFMDDIIDMLMKNETLTSLSFPWTAFGNEWIDIEKAMTKNTTLLEIDLSETYGCSLDVFEKNKSIEKIWLYPDVELKDIWELLQKNNVVNELIYKVDDLFEENIEFVKINTELEMRQTLKKIGRHFNLIGILKKVENIKFQFE
eukprot:gene8898-846_t